ncbi:coiled-coil domain-containing protein 42-like [Silurus meridionalis]|nr:coiled-coil domain-containing protein 42-like [Silurus meridionalis]
MQALEQRRAALLEKQEETKEKAMKFERFVEDNEVKRRRALKKFQLEKKENELREEEKSNLQKELEQLQIRHQQLKERVDKYKIYEEYMVKILELLPESKKSYSENGSDSLVMPIIRRHETLSITQQDLLQRLSSLSEELDQGRCNLDSITLEHNTSKLMSTKELSEQQSQWEQIREINKQLEMTLYTQHDQSRDQIEEIGTILLAVKNLAQQCHQQHYGPLNEMDLLTMMDMIKVQMDTSKLVSIKEATSVQTLEASEDQKHQDICQQFGFIRRVKGDGNCFYRALCFTLVESLLYSEHTHPIERFREKLMRSQEVLLSAGFDEGAFEGLLNAEVEAMSMECDHVEILALSEELDVSLCIISMEGSDGHLTYHTIPEGSQPFLYLLYKTSHYDILYKHREHWK